MMLLFLLGYLLPAVLIFLYMLLYEKETTTIRELLGSWYCYLIPILNFYLIIVLIASLILDFFEDKIKCTKAKKLLNEFLNKKLNKL
jgi:hypothetical protein